jgi:predicted acyl esterase
VWKAAVEGLPLAAIVPTATWTDLNEALAPQGLVRAGILLGFSQDIPQQRYGPEERQLLSDALAERNIQALQTYAASRSTRAQCGSIRIPTLMLQGRRDFAFDANQAIAAYNRIRGPKRLYIGDFGHTPAANPPDEFAYLALEVRAWFDRFLKGVPNGIDKRAPVEIAPDPWRRPTASFKTLPKTRTLKFAFSKRSALTADGKVVRTTKHVAHLETFGSPIVSVQFSEGRTGYQHLVAVLSALTPAGKEIVVADGGTVTPTAAGRARKVTIRLQNEVTSIPRGSRLRVTLGARSTVQSIANLVYLIAVPDGSTATVRDVNLSLPVLRKPISP